jgi:hypothetical protein
MDTLTIEFDDRPEKVVTRQSPLTLREYYSVQDVRAKAVWAKRASIEAVHAAFAPFLVSWDFDVHPTAEGMADLDIVLVMTIVDTWLREVRNVDPPLARRSSGGDTSQPPESPQP